MHLICRLAPLANPRQGAWRRWQQQHFRVLAALRLLSGYPERHHPKMPDPAHLHHPFHRLLDGRWHLARLVRPWWCGRWEVLEGLGAKIRDSCNCSIHKIHCARYLWPPKSQRTRGPPAFSVQGHALCGGHLLLRARRRGCQGVARIVQRAGSPHRRCPDGRCRGWPGPCDQEQDRLKGQGVKISACCSQ